MLGAILVIVGVALMAVGLVALVGWLAGRSGPAQAVLDRAGDSKVDRQFLGLYFFVLVLGPLLGGALMIALGLRQLV